MPQATVHSSLVAEAWLAWHSMQRSMMWLRQMAQLSTTMSQAQRATAFHCALLITSQSCLNLTQRLTFLTSKRFLSPVSVLAPALATFVLGAGASAISTSAMVFVDVGVAGRRRSYGEVGGGGCRRYMREWSVGRQTR